MDVVHQDDGRPNTPENVLQRSLEDFKATLTQAQRESFPEYTAKHVKVKILGIQHHQERVKAMMNFPRIQLFLERFEEFDRVCRSAKVAGNLTDEVSAFIWGPTAYILQVAQEDSGILIVVLDAYQAFGKRIPALQQHDEFIKSQPNDMMCLAHMYHDLLQFYRKMIKLLTGRGWKKIFHVDWGDYKSEFDIILTSFDDHGKILAELSKAWQQRNTQLPFGGQIVPWNVRCRQLMDHYEHERARKLQAAGEAERVRREEQTTEVLRWLRPPDGLEQEPRHKKHQEIRAQFPETSAWILKEDKMLNWMHEEIPPHNIMWLNGKAGAGKSVLASTVIDGCGNIEDFKTTYFYCRQDDPGLSTAAAVLKDILRQLLIHNQDPLPSCRHKKVNGSEEVLSNIDTIKSLLELFCEADMKQFVVIDGLDECRIQEVKAIVKFWTSMVEKCDEYKPGKLRVLFVSQYTDDIRKLMQNAVVFGLTPEQSDDDIEKYVKARLNDLQRRWEGYITPEETTMAKDRVLERCQGCFLYARLAIDYLSWLHHPRHVQMEWSENMLPPDLGKAYEKTINRLERENNNNNWNMAKKIFSLLAGALRPLKWYELQAALHIEESGSRILHRGDELSVEDIERVCGGLVQKLENRVEFIHSTTKENILASRHVDRRKVACDMAVLCLSYLSLAQFQNNLKSKFVEEAIMNGHYSFQDYAVAKWNTHLEMIIGFAFADFFIASGQDEMMLTEALANFVRFHMESIKLAEEKEKKKGKEKHLNPRPSQKQATQPRSPMSSQQSSSSRSPTPSQPTQSQQEEHDPANDCHALKDRPFYQDLVVLWTHIWKHRKADYKERYKVSLPNLDKALENSRKKIEELARDESKVDLLVQRYGERYFKCQRITCDFFHEGFETKSELDSHSNRHDRPYHCPSETCSMQPFGFSTNKDKDKHIRNYHPELSDGQAQFKHGPPGGKNPVPDAKHKCNICNKSFTRQSILKEHTDAHYGERKHACETCGRRFTRANDRNRHRKIHVRRPKGA
ncbi:hypothetical protein OQA88_7973 [Cercophora sp. LCS_1]